MKNLLSLFILLSLWSCAGEENSHQVVADYPTVETEDNNTIENYFKENKGNDQPSKSLGTVSDGALVNGKLFPFKDINFQYFDTASYLLGRAFLNDKLKKTILETYKELYVQIPEKMFFIMECANQKGGKIVPHRTHQNGLSVDFMMPMMKDNQQYLGLDTIGASHYWLDLDNEGRYSKDKSISIDFDLVARHILALNKNAQNNQLQIRKVIIKIELKDELYKTPYGKQLKKSGIYVVESLSPLINSLHDDHYHIDFEIVNN